VIESALRLLRFEAMSQIVSRIPPDSSPKQFFSAQSLRTLRVGGDLSSAEEFTAETPSPLRWRRELDVLADGIKRRWARERRRRKVGRAYDMALEIARMIPRGSEVLDVGCGNGFIAHHLSALLGTSVIGIDVSETTEASIDFRSFDGVRFPIGDNSVDAVLLCYVLHHAQDVRAVLNEVRRVLRDGGRVIIYEDIPQTWWDKGVCWIHNRQWQDRTGPCTFRNESEWQALFESLGYEIIRERQLSRWRNLTHPVTRQFYVLTKDVL
jgi:ubiquinone/menaquinone biosynthesis C-methylase UbiE